MRIRAASPNPVLSTLDNFYDEYVEHVRDKHAVPNNASLC